MMKKEQKKECVGGKSMCQKEILINGVKAVVNVPNSLLEGTVEEEE